MKLNLATLTALIGLSFVGSLIGDVQANDHTQKADENRVKILFDAMKNEKYGIEFPKLDLTDVPALLEYADSTKLLKRFPRNPASSQYETQCTEGMVAIWLIEGVRLGSKYPSLNALCFKTGIDTKDWTKASEDNHKEVAKAYRAWWLKVKNMAPEEAKTINPLTDTGLFWHGWIGK